MIYAIIVLFLYCFYLHLTKASCQDVPYNLKDDMKKVDKLYKVMHQPLAEEYRILKGYEQMLALSDRVCFGNQKHYINDGKVFFKEEEIKYAELSDKLEQLKKDMKRGCEIYCKE